MSRFKYVVEAELERRMKGPGVSCQEGQHLGLVLVGGEDVKEEPRPLRAIPFSVGW